MSKIQRTGPLETTETPLPPKAEPNRIIIKRVWTDADGSQERTIDYIEQVKPGLLRTYREMRRYGPRELPVTPPEKA